MARPNISEFSYGYVLTEELATQHKNVLTAAPVFPSLREEAKVGWDVRLDALGIPMFLRFKLAHPVVRRTARECKKGFLQPPFYRMHPRPARLSRQHEALTQLEANGHFVRYVAPGFHEPTDLYEAYLARQVAQRSFWVRPGAIQLPTLGDHHIAFQRPSDRGFVLCSDPQAVVEPIDFESLLAEVRRRTERPPETRVRESFDRLSIDLMAVIRESRRPRPSRRRTRRQELEDEARPNVATRLRINDLPADAMVEGSKEPLDNLLDRVHAELPPIQRAAFLARTFFDAALLIVGPPQA